MSGPLENLKEEVSDEVAAILATDFDVTATTTQSVPHSGDGAITFPNLDAKLLRTKILESCVLYVDIRRSTELNLQHRPQTVSKLYSAFVRAMTRCAQRNGGHVRGIIGDRVMVLFDAKDCFVSAVETAQSMNSVSRYVINKHFKANEVSCGIGIDHGRMLVTKTGFRRHGNEQQNYRSLVWLGRPANVASKLTDLANKPSELQDRLYLEVAQTQQGSLGLGASTLAQALYPQPTNALAPQSSGWTWREIGFKEFLEGFEKDYSTGQWKHKMPNLASWIVSTRSVETRPKTPAILMTKAVYDGYRAATPTANSIVKSWYEECRINVPGYSGKVYGGDVIWTNFK